MQKTIFIFTMKTFVIGDIHGSYKALLQVLKRSKFDYTKDRLISLGDIADGWSEVYECVEKLLKIKNFVGIKGNHDYWLEQWLLFGVSEHIWTSKGGKTSKDSYIRNNGFDNKLHLNFFRNQHYYYVDEKNRLYIHGGYNWKKNINETPNKDKMWDRHMYQTALYWQFKHDSCGKDLLKIKDYHEVFIGHTTTLWNDTHKFNSYIPSDKPVHVSNIWNIDTGAGWDGKLTIMNIDTKEYFQSDNVKDLYKNEIGRK